MRKFKTESQKLLDLMINSIYTNREIFLRELISNASDAVDKLYFKSLTDSSIQLSKDDLAIYLSFDKDARTITVSDTGIGMTADELEKNLGTIAHSGSQEFKASEEVASSDAADIIGQFGVGFYSSFMVAKKVRVVTRAYGEDVAHVWESDGVKGYTISEGERDSHGTDVILLLKDNTDDDDFDAYLSESALTNLVRRYSNYVRYPIKMEVTKVHPVLASDSTDDAEDSEPPEVNYEEYTEIDTINSMIPIWKRRKSEVSDEEYNEFYKSDFHDYDDPLSVITVHAEGALSYDALLYIPAHVPMDFHDQAWEKGLALYSSNVLIMDKCSDLIPDCYTFMRGVVDSQDLTLNISRETLQRNSQLRAIGQRIEKKITSELEKMRDNDRDNYETFFDAFGRCLKYGICGSHMGSNGSTPVDTLASMLMFYSAKLEKIVTLDEYVAEMGEDQEDIYYVAGESMERLGHLPVVRAVKKKGFDVLLCTEDLDEFCLKTLASYKEHGFTNVTTAELDLGTEEEKKAAEETIEANKDLFEKMQEILAGSVSEVTVSPHLTGAPACLTAKGPVSLEMEKMLRRRPDGEGVRAQRVLELNATHPIFDKLKTAFADEKDAEVRLYTDVLYNMALMVEGLEIESPLSFAEDICALMVRAE